MRVPAPPRPRPLALALLAALATGVGAGGLAACGPAAAPAEEPAPPARARDGERRSPFVDREDFEPRAFQVEVTGSGRPMIFIPGLGSPGAVWDETVAHLSGEYECHVITLAGFAGTAPIDEPISAAVRRDLTRYIRARRLERPIVVGHSMGGFIALWLAASFPENTGPVIVVDAGPALSGDLDAARALRDRWAEATDEEFAARARSMYGGMANDPRRLARISALAAKSDCRTIGEAIYEMVITDLRDDLAAIRAPVLFLLADGPYQHRIRRQTTRLRDKEIVVLPRTRHFVMIDAPKAFLAAIDAFLAAHEKT